MISLNDASLKLKPERGLPFRFEIRDAAFKKLILEVIARIPIETEGFSLFGIIESELGVGIWGHVDGAELIQFNMKEIKKCKLGRDAKVGIIAHEFGHLFLQHLDANYSEEDLREIEKAADDRAIEGDLGERYLPCVKLMQIS